MPHGKLYAAMPETRFQIDVVPKEELVDPRELLPILDNALDALRSIERDSSETRRAFSAWRIADASVHSPLHMTLLDVAESEQSAVAVKVYLSGLSQLESDEPLQDPPQFFNVPTLRYTQKMVAVLNGNVAAVKLSAPDGQAVMCTRRTQANVEQLLAAKYSDIGAIEGILETASIHKRRSFNLYDPLTKDKVTCHFSADRVEDVRAAWTGRVAVYGEVRYDKHGKPMSVIVENIRRLPSDVLRIEDIPPIDITGGIESSDYIRRLRRGE